MEKRFNIEGVLEVVVKDVNNGFKADVYTTAGKQFVLSRTFGSLQEVSQYIDNMKEVLK
mgnify:FL=1